jgi:hypothetical protein
MASTSKLCPLSTVSHITADQLAAIRKQIALVVGIDQ